MPLIFVSMEPSDPRAAVLINELSAELASRYESIWPSDGRSNYRPEEFDPRTEIFLAGYIGNETVCCGALRQFGSSVAEIKRMYVRPGFRGQGAGRALLAKLEQEAAGLGYAEVVLETGSEQPEALGLYRNAGYSPAEPWPPYDKRPYARCFRKCITGDDALE